MSYSADILDYGYRDAKQTYAHNYLLQPLRKIIESKKWSSRRAFDLGCGNGAACQFLAGLGFEAVGVDPSESGVAQAKLAGVNVQTGSAYDDLVSQYGTFPLVISLEVIEHCINPRLFASTFVSLIEPGGVGILSTPYHSYWKNSPLPCLARWTRTSPLFGTVATSNSSRSKL